ncbi:MFS transporter [Massilia sp. SM-13]|uniref:MFS transporter n=1 Tax=Pseudoduganella rhizocola TaxID=3382643 RepID=UPI0038B4959A
MSQASLAPPVPRLVLASLALTMLLPSLGTSIANVALPSMAQALHAPFHQVQWIVLAYLLAITISIVSVGRLGDLLGRRGTLLAGIALFVLASALCAGATTLPLLVAARALQGLGAAVMMALTLALVSELVPKQRTGSAMGLLATASAAGTALGPSLGGLLIAHYGWPAIFLLNLPLGLGTLVLANRSLPPAPRAAASARVRFDHRGTLLLAAALGAYALALTGPGRPAWHTAGLLLAALAATLAFLRNEAHAPAPLLQLAVLRAPRFSRSFAMSALVATVAMATLVVGPFYLAAALGLAPDRVGLVMATGPLAAALVGMPAGRLVDRFGAARMTRHGLLAMLAGALLLALLPARWGVAAYSSALVLITAGYGLFQSANNTAVMAGAAPDQRGAISGVLTLSRNLGLITGASLMGALFAWGVGSRDIAHATTGAIEAGMHLTYGAATLLSAAALLLAAGNARRAAATGEQP